MYESLIALYEVIMANPYSRAAVFGLVRNITGYLQNKYFGQTGKPYDRKVLAATIIKYEVAINAAEQTLPLLGLPVEAVGPAIVIIDILQSWARKILGTNP